MAQVTALVAALKATLKAAGIRYASVARTLGLSESSIKRKFSRREFSLAELDQICALAGTDIAGLVKHMEQEAGRLQCLAVEQEREIAADLGLLTVAVSVLNHWRFEDLLSFYVFDEHQLIRKLATLDRLRLIELQPGNRNPAAGGTEFQLAAERAHRKGIPAGDPERFFRYPLRPGKPTS